MKNFWKMQKATDMVKKKRHWRKQALRSIATLMWYPFIFALYKTNSRVNMERLNQTCIHWNSYMEKCRKRIVNWEWSTFLWNFPLSCSVTVARKNLFVKSGNDAWLPWNTKKKAWLSGNLHAHAFNIQNLTKQTWNTYLVLICSNNMNRKLIW